MKKANEVKSQKLQSVYEVRTMKERAKVQIGQSRQQQDMELRARYRKIE